MATRVSLNSTLFPILFPTFVLTYTRVPYWNTLLKSSFHTQWGSNPLYLSLDESLTIGVCVQYASIWCLVIAPALSGIEPDSSGSRTPLHKTSEPFALNSNVSGIWTLPPVPLRHFIHPCKGFNFAYYGSVCQPVHLHNLYQLIAVAWYSLYHIEIHYRCYVRITWEV